MSHFHNVENKLSVHCKTAITHAMEFVYEQRRGTVQILHVIWQYIRDPESDMCAVLQHQNLHVLDVARRLERTIGRTIDYQPIVAHEPEQCEQLKRLLQEAWLTASLDCGDAVIRSSHVVAAMLKSPDLQEHLRRIDPTLAALSYQQLVRDLPHITANTRERRAAEEQATRGKPASYLQEYGRDLTAEAREGKLAPCSKRKSEITNVINILLNRQSHNPILLGDAGVGKTAIVEEVARMLVRGELPERLSKHQLFALNMTNLKADISFRGEFEVRLKGILGEIARNKEEGRPVILFIDEAHMLVGAGGATGTGDAANLLKPALDRGEIQVIAATTTYEYTKYIEPDKALSRRFQQVVVDEPDEQTCVEMLLEHAKKLKQHHRISIPRAAIESAVALSVRYLRAQNLPHKAVQVLERACSYVEKSQTDTPQPIVEQRELVDKLLLELPSSRNAPGGEEVVRRHADEKRKLDLLERRWERERDLCKRLDACDNAPHGAADEVRRVSDELEELQGDDPWVYPYVDQRAIEAAIQDSSRVRLPRRSARGKHAETMLKESIIGQPRAISELADTVNMWLSGLADPRKPIGALLFVGPDGVGMTTAARALAETIYGDARRNMTVINLAEFTRDEDKSNLVGIGQGYTGYGDPTLLAEPVRRNPQRLLLLEHVNEASQGIQNRLADVLDRGVLTDGTVKEVDFRNTVIVMTANASGLRMPESSSDSRRSRQELALLDKQIRDELRTTLSPLLMQRMRVVPFFPLDFNSLRDIVSRQLEQQRISLRRDRGLEVRYSPQVIDHVAKEAFGCQAGPRASERMIRYELQAVLARALQAREDRAPQAMIARFAVDSGGEFVCDLESAPAASS